MPPVLLTLQPKNLYINNKYTSQLLADDITSFKVCQRLVTVHPLFSSYTDVKYVAVWLPHPQMITHVTFHKNV